MSELQGWPVSSNLLHLHHGHTQFRQLYQQLQWLIPICSYASSEGADIFSKSPVASIIMSDKATELDPAQHQSNGSIGPINDGLDTTARPYRVEDLPLETLQAIICHVRYLVLALRGDNLYL